MPTVPVGKEDVTLPAEKGAELEATVLEALLVATGVVTPEEEDSAVLEAFVVASAVVEAEEDTTGALLGP